MFVSFFLFRLHRSMWLLCNILIWCATMPTDSRRNNYQEESFHPMRFSSNLKSITSPLVSWQHAMCQENMGLKGSMKCLNLKFSLNYSCWDLVDRFLSFLYVTYITNRKIIITKMLYIVSAKLILFHLQCSLTKEGIDGKLTPVYLVIFAGTHIMPRY